MKRFLLPFLLALAGAAMPLHAQNVSVKAHNRPAEPVFAELMTRSGMNFIYPAGLLASLRVTVTADNQPLPKVLDTMLAGSGIGYRIRGKNVILYRKETPHPGRRSILLPLL